MYEAARLDCDNEVLEITLIGASADLVEAGLAGTAVCTNLGVSSYSIS